MNKKEIYLAALFHDFGKLIERSKVYPNNKINELFSDIKYSHARYTAFFLKSYFSGDNWIKGNKEKILEISANHHNPKSSEGRIIQLADWLASSEREMDPENTSQYNTIQLKSIFGTLYGEKIKKFYPLQRLSFNNLFPKEKNEKKTRESYQNLSEKFILEFKRVQNKEDLYYFLERYFSFVPAQTTKSNPDISLFDHSRLTAAISVCLYHQVKNGKLNDEQVKDYLKRISEKEQIDDEHFILLNADLSGIQNYIFSIPSKGAAKSLKGRSTYLILLMEAISDFIIKKLDLEQANIIYNGGGNFYILAPACLENIIIKLRKEIVEMILNAHQEKLFCNIGYTKIKLKEFGDFKEVWRKAGEETAKVKQQKLSEIWEDNYENLFEPKDIIVDDKFCSVCHSTIDVKEREELENLKLCSLCYSFKDLTENIAQTKSITIQSIQSGKENYTYKDILSKFGLNIKFKNSLPQTGDEYILNEFGNEQTLKWRLGAYNLPINKDGKIKTFEDIADKNGKLAYLKIDVDNLGQLFIAGLNNPSLSRMSVLSRMLRNFFEGFLPYFIKTLNLENDIYIVFSGGDDTFLIGDVETILNFTMKLRERFKEFVSGNKKITFSAGIGIFRYNFPVIKAAQITEQYLEDAKSLVYPEDKEKGEGEPKKDKVTIFGEVFTWNEFGYILELYNAIRKEINENPSNSRNIIQKIINSTKGFKPLLDSAQKGKLNSQRIWRLRYYLRTATKNTKDSKFKDRIIKVYEKMWLENLYITEDNKEYEIKNHQIITVAAKLADLQTRKKEE